MFCEGGMQLGLLGVVKVFEMPEAHMARRHTQHHGGTLLLLAPHRGVGADHAQGARSGYAQGVQRFGREELADRGRSEERRGGKEWVSTCRSWGLPYK